MASVLLVRLEPDLPEYRVAGLVHAMLGHPGVQSVTDLAAISQATLDAILRPAEPSPTRGVRRPRRP